MNYLTNYYKNLSEQLQEKVNHLEKLIKESEATYEPDVSNMIAHNVAHKISTDMPHIKPSEGSKMSAQEASYQDLMAKLKKAGPFKSAKDAVMAIDQHAIQDNPKVLERMKAGAGAMEKPGYDASVSQAEQEYIDHVIKHVEGMM